MSRTYVSRSEPGRVVFVYKPGSGLRGAVGMFALSVILSVIFFIPNWLGGLYLGIPIGLAVGVLVLLRSREGRTIVVDQDAGEISVDRGSGLLRETHRVSFQDLDSFYLLDHSLGRFSMGWEVRLVARRGDPVTLNPPSLGVLPFRALPEEEARVLAQKLAEALGSSWTSTIEGLGRIRFQPGE